MTRADGVAGKSNKPKNYRFTQQELPACRPALTPKWVIMTYVSIGLVFVGIGIAALRASGQVVEIVRRYDDLCIPDEYSERELEFITDSGTDKSCFMNITVNKFMMKPIFVYYQLENFYQNHREYVESRSDKQLRTKSHENDVEKCQPQGTANFTNIVPCGLIAWSLFNDTYKFTLHNKSVPVNKTGISWRSDREHKFGSKVFPKNFQNGGYVGGGKLNTSIPLSEQEDLIVWMRTAAMPTFRKLYGRIEMDIHPNETVSVVVQNNYNTYSFGGKKKLVLSTTSVIGGKNNFLGLAYLAVGGICLILGLIYSILHILLPMPVGNQTAGR